MTDRRVAIVFDLGGVVLRSPFEAIAAYEREVGAPVGSVNRAAAGGDAWPAWERGALTPDAFARAFGAELEAAGAVGIDPLELIRRIEEAAEPIPEVLDAIDDLRAAGHPVGALSNTWPGFAARFPAELRDRFDVLVSSSEAGVRKPEPAAYRLVCRRLGVGPGDVVFLDDIGANLKAARSLGMTTIKVDDPVAAIAELRDRLAHGDLRPGP